MNLGRKKVALKSTVDEALASCPQVQTVFVSKRTGADIKIHPRYGVFFRVYMCWRTYYYFALFWIARVSESVSSEDPDPGSIITKKLFLHFFFFYISSCSFFKLIYFLRGR